MFKVLQNSWALLLGILLLMLGNGLQGSLLALSGPDRGFSVSEMSFVMSAYFLGFFGGSRTAPYLIKQVGHVRVFAALASLVSAILILYATIPAVWAWFILRVMIGFCFSGIYVVAESWLNNTASNEVRGQTLSLYLVVQMLGIVSAQFMLNIGDPNEYLLFVIPSVLISFSFLPILLSVSPVPVYEATKPMTIFELYRVSPLGCVGALLLGAIFAGLFGMGALYGKLSGLEKSEIALFVAMIYIGGMLMQYPIGLLSDRMDRRVLIAALSCACGVLTFLSIGFLDDFLVLLAVAFLIGGVANPLYSLFIAYTNDFLDYDNMAAASGGLIFLNGIGAVAGPLVVGWIMNQLGPVGFFYYLAGLLLMIGAYALYRMTRRATAGAVEEAAPYVPVTLVSSPVAVDAAREVAIEMAQEEEACESPENR